MSWGGRGVCIDQVVKHLPSKRKKEIGRKEEGREEGREGTREEPPDYLENLHLFPEKI
jgi:hypothetical protein